MDRVWQHCAVSCLYPFPSKENSTGPSVAVPRRALVCDHVLFLFTVRHFPSGAPICQVKSRAARLGITSPNLHLMNEGNVDVVLHEVDLARQAGVQFAAVFVDSIQTAFLPEASGGPGSVSQVCVCVGGGGVGVGGGGRAQDTLSFVDVRFKAYNKNPDNTCRSQLRSPNSFTCVLSHHTFLVA